MIGIRSVGRTACVIASLLLSTSASPGARVTYDFDDLAPGLDISTLLEGVTIETVGDSCSSSPPVVMEIVQPPATASGTQALGITTGCPDFSTDFLRMTFDQLQDSVTFFLGPDGGTYQVRAYANAVGGTPISTQTTTAIIGTVNRFVSVTTGATNIRRIEVESLISAFEYIDDLTFDLDDTPPVARIEEPSPFDCVCDLVSIRGVAFDPEGSYEMDTAEWSADPNGTWNLIGSAGSPLTTTATLYVWDTSSLSEGNYFVRLVVTNNAGLSTTVVTTWHVSRDFDTLSVATSSIGAGTICVSGTIEDNRCSETFTVEYSAAGSGDYQPVDPATPVYTGSRINQTVATWNTVALGIPDGDYDLRVIATNECGHEQSDVLATTVDNTPPISQITSHENCERIDDSLIQFTGTAFDVNLNSWSLQYTGGPTNGWVTIASGNANVINGVLGVWNVTDLPPCTYTVRLVVTDKASVNCSGNGNRTDFNVSLDVGCIADFNRDGLGNVNDLLGFLAKWFEGCD